MLTASQAASIRAHFALDARTQELINLARADLFHGPGANDDEDYPGFAAACHIIRESLDVGDLYVDSDFDDVIGDTEPSYDPDDDTSYSPDRVVHVDSREVVRVLVGTELARYV